MANRKAHYVEVTMSSVSNDSLNQELIFREFDDTQEGLVEKNFAVADVVIPGLLAKMRELAGRFLRK